MKTPALFLLAALLAASTAANAQAAANDQRADVTDHLNAAPAASQKRLTGPVTAGQAAATAPSAAADLSTLAPKDHAAKPHDEFRRDDRYNSRGVNCSLYPARC